MLSDQPGYFSSGRPPIVALDQIGTMLSPCSPRIRAETCVGGALELLGDQAAEADRVELRAQADAPATAAASAARPPGRSARRPGSRRPARSRPCLMPDLADLGQDAQEQIDVAIDQVEPALVGLAAQAGGDADHVARRHVLVAAGARSAGRPSAGAVQQVERLARRPARRWRRSSAISRTMPPDCRANAVHEPTSPPPPMMLTFMLGGFRVRGSAVQR